MNKSIYKRESEKMGKVLIQCGQIIFSYCGGRGPAKAYTDKRGRIRYCSNPYHNHYYAGGCFIATACFGSDSKEVSVLRNFRDKFLLNYRIGKLFVWGYYKISPVIATLLVKYRALRTMTRHFLRPFVYLAKNIVEK